MDHLCYDVYCDCYAFASVHCCLVVTCLERADLLALVCDVYCGFVTFSCGIPGQVWHLIVSIPDLCNLSYFYYPNFLTLNVIYAIKSSKKIPRSLRFINN